MSHKKTEQVKATRASNQTASNATHTVNKLWTKNFVIGTLLNFIIYCNYFMLMVIMTAYAIKVYDAPDSLAGLCASVFIIGTLVARFAITPIMAKIGRKVTLFAGACILIVFTAFYLIPMPLELLITTRFFHGFGYGIASTAIATIVTSIVPPERKGEGIGYYMLASTVGAAIGPFIGVMVSKNAGYVPLFAIALIDAIAAIPCIIAIHTPEPEKNKDKDKKFQVTQMTDKTMALEAIESSEDELAAGIINAPIESKREMNVGEKLENKDLRQPSTAMEAKIVEKFQGSRISYFIEVPVLPISVVCGLLFFGYSSLLTFLTPYADKIGLARAAGVFFIVYAIIMFLTRPFMGRVFDRRGPHVVMVPAFISFTASMVMLAFASNDWMILGSAALAGFGVGTVQSCGMAMAVRVTPDERISLANATYHIMLDAGVGIGPLLLGLVTPIIGYSMMYVCMAVLGVVALTLFLIVAKTETQASL